MAEDPLRDQVAYYRRRAAEYDTDAYGDRAWVQTRITALVDEVRPSGDVLEIACGTGRWTLALLRHARSVTAIDAAPEMIALARSRLPAGAAVRFIVADVFDWTPVRRYDTVFFAFWLSHVPAAAFDTFWSSVRRSLTAGGRAVFVDEQPTQARKEEYVAGSAEVVRRRLSDGSVHRVVKVFYDPDELVARLDGLGWRAGVHQVGADWFIGQARPKAPPAGPHRSITS